MSLREILGCDDDGIEIASLEDVGFKELFDLMADLELALTEVLLALNMMRSDTLH